MYGKSAGAHIVRRIIVMVAGLWIMAMGVSFSIIAGLGTSPISSLPYTLSLLTPLTVGSATILVNALMVLLQVIILRRRFHPVQLLQVVVSSVFGILIDFVSSFIGILAPSGYVSSWLYCLLGIVLVGTGVSLEVLSSTVPLAAEGLSLAISQVSGRRFGTIKVSVDLSLVVLSLALSVPLLHSLGGVREGTLAAALLVGTVARILNRALRPVRERFFSLQ